MRKWVITYLDIMKLVTDKNTIKSLIKEIIALPEIGKSIKRNLIIRTAKKAVREVGIPKADASVYLLMLERDLKTRLNNYTTWTTDDFKEDAFNYSLEESMIEAEINEFKSPLTEENPFAAGAEKAKDDKGDSGEEESGGEESEKDDSGEEDKKKKKPEEESDALSIEFEPARVKSYNDKKFISTSGEVTKITKDGMTVKIKPDNVDVHVNFDDISESAKAFFKK